MRGLQDKAIILTGGASGIGRDAAIRLAEEGARVGIFDLDEAGAQATVERIGRTARRPIASTSATGTR